MTATDPKRTVTLVASMGQNTPLGLPLSQVYQPLERQLSGYNRLLTLTKWPVIQLASVG